MVGVVPALNEKVWVYGIFVEAISIDFVYICLAGYALGKIYKGADSSAQDLAYSQITLEFLIFFAMEAVTYSGLSSNFGPWSQGNEPEEKEEVTDV